MARLFLAFAVFLAMIVGCQRSSTPRTAAPVAKVAVPPTSPPAPPSRAEPKPSAEIELIGTVLATSKEKESFYSTSEGQLERLVAAGVLPNEANHRLDYNSYFRPLKQLSFHGAKLLYFEYEFMEEFIGCCVNDGFGMVLQGQPNAEIEAFATEHGCKVNPDYEPDFDIRKEFGQDKIALDSIFELSCRANDSGAP